MKFQEPSDLAIIFDSLELLWTQKSIHQEIKIFQHKSLGKILVLNDEVHHVEAWAPLYHEMITHFPASFIPELRNVLILGGGSLFAASEVLKYRTVQKVLLVEHDQQVIDAVKLNYSHAQSVLNDSRFELYIGDAFEYTKKQSFKFDLIVNDSVDLLNHGRSINMDIISMLPEKLTEHGVCCDLVYRHIFEKSSTLETIAKIRNQYFNQFSLIAIPEYPGVFHVLCLWSKQNKLKVERKVANENQRDWLSRKESPCVYYNPGFQRFYAYLPTYLTDMLDTFSFL